MTNPGSAATQPAFRRKLIEVSLPLEDINRASAREKSIRHGHPSALHLWWARRPLASARAVLFAQLVDDPSSRLDEFPTEEAQKAERERLHNIIRRLVVWENINDEKLLAEAHAEILKSTDGKPPKMLDPFAGGGTIPLEAQRLGLEAHASDLNPVAVLINKALIEIPPKFAGQKPVFPGAAEERMGEWPRATGLAEDVRRYGSWMRDRAQERIGYLYPKATIHDEKTGTSIEAAVIAWIWARTVTCPNPACGIEMPLVRSWWLGKKKGKEAYVVPTIVEDSVAPSGRRVEFTIGHDTAAAPTAAGDGTVGRTGANCVACGAAVPLDYVRAEGRAKRMGANLMAVVAEGDRSRVYIAPTPAHQTAADVARPSSVPQGEIFDWPGRINVFRYGMTQWADLFTNRQLATLATFSDLVGEAREQVLKDALESGLPHGGRLAEGGTDAEGYADAVCTYLGVAMSGPLARNCTIATWDAGPVGTRASTGGSARTGSVRTAFSRQALPMTWDFAEANPLGESAGSYISAYKHIVPAIDRLDAGVAASVNQSDASARSYSGFVISTDPPYYDNIGYSDLSDFFYVWLRRSLRSLHRDLFSTMLVPKAEELVANPYRHGGKRGASEFFELGFETIFARARESAAEGYPVTVYYAFKQQELKSEGVASTGWATILEGIIRSGWAITATWPVRTEMASRMIATGANALASSIVLSLRPRQAIASATSRRGFLGALKAELPKALSEMQQGAIAPVDLAQSTIGPGMAIFSRYSSVLENDGSAMSVKTALVLINQVLDEVLAENDGDLDSTSRFCLKWYLHYGWADAQYGDAEVLATATNVSVRGLKEAGVLKSGEGKVRLIRPADLPASWNPAVDDRISVWEVACQLARVLSDESGGIEPTARMLAAVRERGDVDLDAVQLLAYRLYELTQSKRPEDARLFNALGGSWADLTTAAGSINPTVYVQDQLDFGDDA